MKHFKRPLLVVFSLMLLLLMSISADAAFKVTRKNLSKPGTLTVGLPYVIKGSLSSNEVMKKVTTAIYDSTGKKVIQKYNAKVNGLKYNLSNSTSHMHFETLEPGKYYYKIIAYSVNNEKFMVLEKPFTVKAVKMVITPENVVGPTTLKTGSNFRVRGTLTSNLLMKKVVITIYTGDGSKCLQRSTRNINDTYVNLIDAEPVLDFSRLTAGEYIYRISVYNMQDKKKRILDQPFTVKDAVLPSSIKIKNPVPAKNILNFKQGTAYGISGTITSANKLQTVKAELIGIDGSPRYTNTVKPGTTTYSLQNSALDRAMKFDQLTPGVYTFVVSASDVRGKKAVLINRKFYVMHQSSKFWWDTKVPVVPSSNFTIRRGQSLALSGIIRSNNPITYLEAKITDTKGKEYYLKHDYPERNTQFLYSFGGSGIDNAMHFEKLPAGNYIFSVEVEDSKKSVALIINKSFTVN